MRLAAWGMGLLLALGALAWAGARPTHHLGRPIAPVMSWQGADWLERPDREREEGTRKLIARLDLAPGQVGVDLGCGSGFHARRMAREVGPDGVVWCVDLQPEMLTIAASRAEAEGLPQLRTLLGAEDHLPLPAGTADRVLLVDVWHEVPKPGPMLASIRQALAPGGTVAVVEFRREGDTALHIRPEHRMTADQVIAEWTAGGFVLADRYDGLPSQHLLIFRAGP